MAINGTELSVIAEESNMGNDDIDYNIVFPEVLISGEQNGYNPLQLAC